MGKREKVNMRFLIPAILFIWLMGGGISQTTAADAEFGTGTDSDSTPLGFVKSISIPTIQNNVTLDKEGNIYVNNDGILGAYIYKYNSDGTLINTYQLSAAAHSEHGITCAAVADDGTVYAIVHADYQHSWPMDLVKVDQMTGSVTKIASPSAFWYARCRQGMFIVENDIYAGMSYEPPDKFLIKVKTDGTVVWKAPLGSEQWTGWGDGRYHLAEDGKIYTGHYGSNVVTINSDDGSHLYIGSIWDEAIRGSPAIGFSQGAGIYKDNTGMLWVASPYWNYGGYRDMDRLRKIDIATLKVVEVYGGTGSGPQQLSYPGAILPDPLDSNAFYVVDRGNQRLQKFIFNPNHSPVASAGSDQTIECAGQSGTEVTLNASGSSDPDGDTLTYTWAWAGGSAEGATPTVTLPLGTTEVTLTASDGQDTSTDTVNITVQDNTPPVTTATGGSDNWYNANVISTFSATDICSGVKEIHYTVNGTETVVLGDSASLTLTADGTYSVAYYSIDNAGNAESPKSMTVKIDKTPPVLSLSTTPNILWPPDHKMVDVLIGGDATDVVSGIDSVTFSVADEYGIVQPAISNFNTAIQLEAWREGTDEDGRHYTITAVAADAAGNKTTTSTTVLVPHDQGK